MAEYVVNEAQGSANVCVALIGYVDRTVLATVFTVEGTAEGNYFLALSSTCMLRNSYVLIKGLRTIVG